MIWDLRFLNSGVDSSFVKRNDPYYNPMKDNMDNLFAWKTGARMIACCNRTILASVISKTQGHAPKHNTPLFITDLKQENKYIRTASISNHVSSCNNVGGAPVA